MSIGRETIIADQLGNLRQTIGEYLIGRNQHRVIDVRQQSDPPTAVQSGEVIGMRRWVLPAVPMLLQECAPARTSFQHPLHPDRTSASKATRRLLCRVAK